MHQDSSKKIMHFYTTHISLPIGNVLSHICEDFDNKLLLGFHISLYQNVSDDVNAFLQDTRYTSALYTSPEINICVSKVNIFVSSDLCTVHTH